MESKLTVLKGEACDLSYDPVRGKYTNITKYFLPNVLKQMEDSLEITEGAYMCCEGNWEDRPFLCALWDAHSLHTGRLSLAELKACASETLARRGQCEGSFLPLGTLSPPVS